MNQMVFATTEEALEYATKITKDERDHLWFNYTQRAILLGNFIKTLSPELRRERYDRLMVTATQNQFMRECVEEFDRLSQRCSDYSDTIDLQQQRSI